LFGGAFITSALKKMLTLKIPQNHGIPNKPQVWFVKTIVIKPHLHTFKFHEKRNPELLL
jgi:hypothetical protein